ncbi:MAG: hypothetical protein KKA05_01830, partial [Alphaproteobacteria bacterium]|nr:hypothetical protein [Alphaproteobacteria bacterium]
ISYRNDRLAHGGYNDARNNDSMATRFTYHGGRQDPYCNFAVPQSEAPVRNSKLTVSATIKRELGQENVINCAFRHDGSIDITVPSTFSRSNMALLGVEDAGSLIRRPGPEPGLAIVNVPADRQPDQLKIAPDMITPATGRGFISRILGK